MKKILSTTLLSLIAGAAAFAAPLTPQQAVERLQGDPNSPLPTRSLESLQLKKTFKTLSGEPALYVFDNTQGYMVVSADDLTLPLLGFSEFTSFDPDNVPPALEYWLGEYQRQIEYAREAGVETSSLTRAQLPWWPYIAPMLKTVWNQDAPFNNDCPQLNGRNSYTGCVATSMAQIMNYFQYPEKGNGSITYTCESLGKTLSMDFSKITFDWDNMINNYNGSYTPAQASAVAQLMAACGYSVEMSYSPSSSGAVSGLLPGAFVKYFGYDPAIRYFSRDQVSYTEWATMIYNNLRNIGPVIYDGDTPYSGGHSFVCDGYYKDGYFHFNWGWGGVSDGFYLLNALDPAGIGIGGAAGGFNFDQDIVLYIQPAKPGSTPFKGELYLSGSVQGYNSGNYMYAKIYGEEMPGYRYFGNDQVSFSIGLIIAPENNPSQVTYMECSNPSAYSRMMPLDASHLILMNGSAGYPYPMFRLSNLPLQDNVKYKMTLAYKLEGSDNWVAAPVGNGCFNYFYVTKSGNNYTYDNNDVMEFTCTNLTLESPLYDGHGATWNLTLANNNKNMISRGVTLLLLDNYNNPAFIGDSFVLTLNPGETYSTQWTTSFSSTLTSALKKNTDYYPALLDIDTDEIYYQSTTPVTMQPNPGAPSYSADITFTNAQIQNGTYQVENTADMKVATTVNVTKGYFSYQMAVYVMENKGGGLYAADEYYVPLTLVNAGQSVTIPQTVSFLNANPGTTYYLGLAVNGTLLKDPIIPFVALSTNGVESIGAEKGDIVFFYQKGNSAIEVMVGNNGIESVEAYYLNGMKAPVNVTFNGDRASVDVTGLGKGVILVTAVDRDGNRQTSKIAL